MIVCMCISGIREWILIIWKSFDGIYIGIKNVDLVALQKKKHIINVKIYFRSFTISFQIFAYIFKQNKIIDKRLYLHKK
jgi:hypothetical protein